MPFVGAQQMAGAFNQFVHQRTVLLTTYRRDGTPVSTPVDIVVDGDRAFVRTFDTAWKLKRIRNNSTVKIAPSTARGKPTVRRFALVRECLVVRKPITRAHAK